MTMEIKMHDLFNLISQHKNNNQIGIYSVCSAHPLVIEAAILQAKQDQSQLLIEATSNQVDQFGGYTGMTPKDFAAFVQEIAKRLDFPTEKLILGGDHLGPNRWQNEIAAEAMKKAKQQIREYVDAGFKKIHLDCSMSCAGDPVPLSDDITATRAASLALVAETTAIDLFGSSDIAYVIGTEVPIPGGAQETLNSLEVTSPEAAKFTLQTHQNAFNQLGLDEAWPRVIGLVVQPGVEFDHVGVMDYQPEKAKALSQVVESYPHMVFEAHSTDYQTGQKYQQLVEDHFAILKVGPALTFALREGLFALACIEEELTSARYCSGLRMILEDTMHAVPEHWQQHYQGEANSKRLARSYSYSDRIRYYWPDEKVQQSTDRLLSNLSVHPIPLPLLSQYMPVQYERVRNGELSNQAKALVLDKVMQVLALYSRACTPSFTIA